MPVSIIVVQMSTLNFPSTKSFTTLSSLSLSILPWAMHIFASGTKVAIGDDFSEALMNLVSQYAVDIEVENTDNLEELADLIIKANNNLKTSTQSNDWEQIGKDTKKLQNLVDRLEEVKKELDKKKQEEKEHTNVINDIINETVNEIENVIE